MKRFAFAVLFALTILGARADVHEIIPLWPGNVPGESEAKSPPAISDNHKGDVTRIGKVTDPSIVVYQADPAKSNGAAVIICPGGGYQILAIDKEGYEIASWLNQLGYTAFVLQYRVPKKQDGALQDVIRAIRYVRSTPEKWNIKTDKIGVLGFSAGGSLAARASCRYAEELYPTVDAIDKLSARPDFSVLIYPAYLDQGENNTLTPELKLTKETPPMFLLAATDDGFSKSSLVMGLALQSAKLPYELHILPHGGHGFGIRKGNDAAESWPTLCEKWLNQTIFTPPKESSGHTGNKSH